MLKFLFGIFSIFLCLEPVAFGLGDEPVMNPALIDSTANPCEDFFQYACGKWLEKTPIPADKSNYYRFSQIDDRTELILKGILENYQKGQFSPAQAFAGPMGDFYGSCMDVAKNDAAALEGLKALLDRVSGIQNQDDLARVLAQLHLAGVDAFFSFYAGQDAKNATTVIAQIDRGGLGLPERAYYFDPSKKVIRAHYQVHLQKMLALGGVASSDINAVGRVAYQTELSLARSALTEIQRRDPNRVYNLKTLAELRALAPAFAWDVYFQELQIAAPSQINVWETKFLEGIQVYLASHSLQATKNYLTWRVLTSTSSHATKALAQETFLFFGKELRGQPEPLPQWKKCVATVDRNFPEALGESFVKVAFGEDAKNLAKALVDDLSVELQTLIETSQWMDPVTQQGALRKKNTLVKKIGYPDKFKTYEDLKVTKDSWFQNEIAGAQVAARKNFAKIGKPVDRSEWGMSPPTNNAYYDPTLNEIVFPAGILQVPLFSVKASLAENYGATGATIGHEMTHGFDDEGRQFDENGNLKNWWSDATLKIFSQKAQCLINQYNGYTVADNVHVQGELTLGENIADLGGLKIALRAYERAAKKENVALDMKTFFLSYAQSWCGKGRPEYEKLLVSTNPHSPPKFRVNGIVTDLPEFAEAFQCAAGTTHNPANRCEIW